MGKPYVYVIVGKKKEFYFGVRWCYDGEPQEDLWIKYFTSSSTIKQLIHNNGVDYFKPKVIKLFETKEDALYHEYRLIKNGINSKNCLNKAMGKCAIWDDDLKKQVSNSMKKVWENPEFREKIIFANTGENNKNYGKKPWRNVSGNYESWKKAVIIYDDYLKEKWDFNKRGYGRNLLIRRYDIVQGTARCLIKFLKNNWNPYLDDDYLLFLEGK